MGLVVVDDVDVDLPVCPSCYDGLGVVNVAVVLVVIVVESYIFRMQGYDGYEPLPMFQLPPISPIMSCKKTDLDTEFALGCSRLAQSVMFHM